MINSLNKFKVGQLIHYDYANEGNDRKYLGTIIANDKQGCVIYWHSLDSLSSYKISHKYDMLILDKIREVLVEKQS